MRISSQKVFVRF